jgi:acetyltransferase-like isoleucine patch superfamily enzyme
MPLRVGRWVRAAQGLLRHGGLIGVHRSARVSIQGNFSFGRRVSVGRNTIIQVPADSSLSLGHGVYVGREVEITSLGEISIGNYTSLQDRCQVLGQVRIGAHCVFAPNVFMSSGTHQFMERPAWLIRDQDALVADSARTSAQPRSVPIEVHEDCWIGVNAVVMRGVSIGRGSVVGANSVVTKPVAPYSVVAGAPARVIGLRLEFKPPSALSSANPDDLPYFYSGFDLRQCAIAGSASGFEAFGRFQLALSSLDASRISLEVEPDRPLSVMHGHESHRLAPGRQIISFPLEAPGGDLVTFEARDLRGRPCALRVRRASAEK